MIHWTGSWLTNWAHFGIPGLESIGDFIQNVAEVSLQLYPYVWRRRQSSILEYIYGTGLWLFPLWILADKGFFGGKSYGGEWLRERGDEIFCYQVASILRTSVVVHVVVAEEGETALLWTLKAIFIIFISVCKYIMEVFLGSGLWIRNCSREREGKRGKYPERGFLVKGNKYERNKNSVFSSCFKGPLGWALFLLLWRRIEVVTIKTSKCRCNSYSDVEAALALTGFFMLATFSSFSWFSLACWHGPLSSLDLGSESSPFVGRVFMGTGFFLGRVRVESSSRRALNSASMVIIRSRRSSESCIMNGKRDQT